MTGQMKNMYYTLLLFYCVKIASAYPLLTGRNHSVLQQKYTILSSYKTRPQLEFKVWEFDVSCRQDYLSSRSRQVRCRLEFCEFRS